MNTTILIKPLVTEKSMSTVGDGRYTFAVAKTASKTDIKNILGKQFGVTITSVATSLVKGKTKRVGARRQEITVSSWKKAVVTVKKGEKISLFEPAADDKKEKKK
jgi:large subunit ribosomal protein L23